MRRGFPALQSRLNHTIGSTFNRSSKFNRVDSLLFTFSSSKLTTLSSQFEICPAPVKSSCVHPPSFLFSRSTWNLSQCVMSMNAYAGKRNYSSQEHGKSGSGDDGPRGTKDYEDNSKKRSWRMSSIFKLIRSQWFTISIPIMGYACAMYPEYMSTGGQFSSEKWKDFVIAGVFFMGGLSIRGINELLGRSTGSFRVPFQGHVFIQVFSLLLIPAVICATVPYLPSLGIDLPTHCYLGIIFTGCLPTTIGAGLVLTRAAAGDTVLALLHSAIGNIVGSVLCPITILLTTGLEPTVPLERVVKQIGGLILMPVFGGMLLRSICSLSVANSLNHYSGTVQQLLLLLLLSTVFSNTFNMSDKQVATGGDDPMKMIGPLMGVMGMYFSSFFLVAWFASRAKFLGMQHESRIAASFCATQKTAALGVPMLQVLFNGDPNLHLLSLPLLCYHPLQAILGALFVPFIKRPLK